MTNNDILIRLRYALDIKDSEMVEIFRLGDVDVSIEGIKEILTKPNEEDDEFLVKVNNRMLESFLNGFIIYKRGKQEPRAGQLEKPVFSDESHNNILLKKMKIALSLTSEDMLEILSKAGVNVTKGEMSALLRKKGHKNYKECGDRYARNFLKGLAIKYRG
ncbi:DUF1456 family protein [Bacillaceae bacterium S4-13-56]